MMEYTVVRIDNEPHAATRSLNEHAQHGWQFVDWLVRPEARGYAGEAIMVRPASEPR